MLHYQGGAITKTGKRINNQDNYFLNGLYNKEEHSDCSDGIIGQDRVALFAVADGMGGEEHGERASFVLAERLSRIEKQEPAGMPEAVSSAILSANETLCAIMKEENTGRMGSTVVSLLYADPFVYVGNLGDSPAYLYRDGELTKLTRDHTEGQAMLDGGVLSKEQLRRHASRNRLTRHLGIFPSELELEVAQYPPIGVQNGDVFLLCSDGVNGVLTDDQLQDILALQKNPEDIAEEAVSEAIRFGSRDNCTALVLRFSEKPFPPPDFRDKIETTDATIPDLQSNSKKTVERDERKRLLRRIVAKWRGQV